MSTESKMQQIRELEALSDGYDHQVGKRIMSILGRRTLMSVEQLGVKVCECGNYRPSQTAMLSALSHLVKAGIVCSEPGPGGDDFFYVDGTHRCSLEARREELFSAMASWSNLRDGIADELFYLLRDGGRNMSTQIVAAEKESGPTLLCERTGQSMLILALNDRAWVTVDDPRILTHISRAIQLDVLPVVSARRINPLCRGVLEGLGVRYFEGFNQVVNPALTDVLLPVKHKDIGGIKDLTFTDKLPERLDSWLNHAIWRDFGKAVRKFNENKNFFQRFLDLLQKTSNQNEVDMLCVRLLKSQI